MIRTKDFILERARRKGAVRTSELVGLLRLSRQTAAQHCRELVQAGLLIKAGSTHNARYLPYSRKNAAMLPPDRAYFASYRIRGLEEDRVFQEASMKANLTGTLSDAAYRIVSYAFTEMVNNAIDHSRSERVLVRLNLEHGRLEFQVIDRGIGAFESVRSKFRLKDHFEAAMHILKGKQTTDPARHTGQGIFFTSKIADRFWIDSSRLRLRVDNRLDDIFIEDIRNVRGTRVTFCLSQRSRKALKALFDRFTNDELEFDRTRITVHLSGDRGEHVSRSEARRLLFGLDRFRRIILDFRKVKAVGQGFADEIFRVFRGHHPAIQIEPLNMKPSVEFMVRRAFKSA